jgi:cytidine deaminase
MKDKLLKLLDNSYAPYSNMHFACIVETKDGNFYEGVNVENASYGATVCAERNAIFNAVSHGEKEFKTVYLMTSSEEICYPCNLCKQVFLEFFDKDVIFNVMTKSGKMEVLSYEKLMNTTFTKEDIV